MHDQRVRRGAHKLASVETEHVEIFALRGCLGAFHPFRLEAQHHHDIDTFYAPLEIGVDFHHGIDGFGQQGGRADQLISAPSVDSR